MLNVIFGAVGMWVMLGALYAWREETSNNVVYDVLDYAISLPWIVFGIIVIILCYPFLLIWKFIRNAVRPVSQEAWNKCKFKHFWKCGNLYVVYDEKAKAFCNKLFLVRVAHPADYIDHDPIVTVHNELSVPDGEFR